MVRKSENEFVKAYYRDCGKGLKDGDIRILWTKLRGFPSFFYQSIRINETVNEIAKLKLKGKLLDAACGSGYILSSLPKSSVGIEINPRHVKAAKKNAPDAKVIKGDIENIPFEESSFDVIIATEIFEHLPDSGAVVSELWRVLKQGGSLIVTVPSTHFLWRMRFLASGMYKTEPKLVRFTKKSLLELFSNYRYNVSVLKKIAYGLNYLLVLIKK